MMEKLYDCIADPWWWVVFGTILASGIGGGLARFAQMRAVAPRGANWIPAR